MSYLASLVMTDVNNLGIDDYNIALDEFVKDFYKAVSTNNAVIVENAYYFLGGNITHLINKVNQIADRDGSHNQNFSVDDAMDSDGNRLTAQQAEYFADSKIRDEDGNLRVVYHGTDADFTVFDRSRARANMDIAGNFFSPWQDDAMGYGQNVGAYYLNIVNPAPESAAYRALRMYQGQNGAGIKARDYLIEQGYDGVNNSDLVF